MTAPEYTYRPSAAQLAERMVAAFDAHHAYLAAQEAVAAWEAFSATDDLADWTRFINAMTRLAEVTRG